MCAMDVQCQEGITELLKPSSYHHCLCNQPRELPRGCVLVSLSSLCYVKNASDLVKENSAHSQQSNKDNEIISAQRLCLVS